MYQNGSERRKKTATSSKSKWRIVSGSTVTRLKLLHALPQTLKLAKMSIKKFFNTYSTSLCRKFDDSELKKGDPEKNNMLRQNNEVQNLMAKVLFS